MILSDINDVLISTYQNIIRLDEEFYASLEVFQKDYELALEKDRIYLKWRDEFNQIRQTSTPRRSALFVALNRTCFNGLWRENASGEFNVPFGRLANPNIFEIGRLSDAKHRLENATLTVRGFGELIDEPRAGDVIFLDPPYLPLSGVASFETYSRGGFGPHSHDELSKLISRWVQAGVYVLLCNSDCPETRRIYRDSGLSLYSHMVGRSVGASPKSRVAVQEIIAIPEMAQIDPNVIEEFGLSSAEPDGE
jgi:DNA adenine methylase